MKKIAFFLTVLMSVKSIFSQDSLSKNSMVAKELILSGNKQFWNNSSLQNHDITKDYYLSRSKKFNTIGSILLGVGITAIVIPLAIPESDKYAGTYGIDVTRIYLILGGALSTLSSIPYFISASNNKNKALQISVTSQTAYKSNHGKTESAFLGLCISMKLRL